MSLIQSQSSEFSVGKGDIVVPFFAYIYVSFSYFILLFSGKIRDFCFWLLGRKENLKGYAPLLSGFNSTYTKYIYGRISDCFCRPICSAPGGRVEIIQRNGSPFYDTLKPDGIVLNCLNLGSYNYLGFAENKGICLENDLQTIQQYSTATCSTAFGLGTTELHKQLERAVSSFLGKEDAIVYGMGYGTNSTSIPALIGKGGLILSDSLNHASLVHGCRLSGAKIVVFNHNDAKDLELKIREAMSQGQPLTGKTWNKILIIVEGLYSMEGDIVALPDIVAIKKKYKAYLYIDEAHSIGSLGETGRGVGEYWRVDTSEIDILMGTFTKSFASCGGYVAADANIIESLRLNSFNNYYDNSMSPCCAQQILSSFLVLTGKDGSSSGKTRIETLRRNSIYFRQKLKEKGFLVMGNYDSPVIPVIMYSVVVITAFSRLCLEKKLAVVVVGYPATHLNLARARFCMSSSHSLKDLDEAISLIEPIGDQCLITHSPILKKN